MHSVTVNGNTIPWEEGLTVTKLLQKMNYTFKMLIVKIDGQLIKKEHYADTLVPDGANVQVIHLISGG